MATSLDVHYGLVVHRPQAVARVVAISNTELKGWFGKLMGMRGRPIKHMRSAWDGIDDPFGPDAISPQEDHQRREEARAEANRRQDELNARVAAERHERALDELQDLEGYGSF